MTLDDWLSKKGQLWYVRMKYDLMRSLESGRNTTNFVMVKVTKDEAKSVIADITLEFQGFNSQGMPTFLEKF
jgi:hypothetical protein